MHEALRPFHQATAAWFEQALGEPTLALSLIHISEPTRP